jgi:hypothetical protein
LIAPHPLREGVNQHGSVEDLLHALLAPFVQKKEEEEGIFPLGRGVVYNDLGREAEVIKQAEVEAT